MMAIITNYVGSNWIPNTTQGLQWKYSSWGSWSNAGTATINSSSEFSTAFILNVGISWGPININFNANIIVALTDQNPNAQSGPVNVTINGSVQSVTYNVNDNTILVNNISYDGYTITLEISADGANTDIYVNSGSDLTSFYLQVV